MMDFVFCTDKNYIKGYGVLMLSLLRFCPPPCTERLRFHVLSDDLGDADKGLLKGIAARRENTEVAFYEPASLISEEMLASIGTTLWPSARLTVATYYRLLVADLLPRDARRALYLDGDVLCVSSLGALFETDLKGCPVGMCLDIWQLHAYTYNRLGYPQEEGYFNAGVILYDLDIWRRENLRGAMFEWLKINAKRITMHDQDTINAVLHGKIFPLDLSYNVIGSQFYVYYWLQEERNGYYARETQTLPKSEWPAVLAAVERPRLVHIISKPWFRDSSAPFTPVWRYFYAQSPWAGEPLRRRKLNLSAMARIKRLGRRALERLNLIAPASPPCPQEAYKVGQRLLDELQAEESSS